MQCNHIRVRRIPRTLRSRGLQPARFIGLRAARNRCGIRFICPLAILLVTVIGTIALAANPQKGWEKRDVDLRLTGGSRMRAIYHPANKTAPKLRKPRQYGRSAIRRKFISPEEAARLGPAATSTGEPIQALVIDSPPIDGFVPWITVVASDENSGELEVNAVLKTTVGGGALRPDPIESDYVIGLYDTGAGAHVMGNAAGIELGLFFHSLLTTYMVEIGGVTGSTDAHVSEAIGLYIDGLDAIDPNTLMLDTTGMVGETNVSIAVGQTPGPDESDIPTAIGAPMAVLYSAVFDNDQPVTVTRNSVEYVAPNIQFYESDDPTIPSYPNLVPLELRPLGGIAVQYTPCGDFTEYCLSSFPPQIPSVVADAIGPTQSLFFVSSVDLYEGSKIAIDKNRFMLDTGAQVTVIGNRIGARLGLDPASYDFLVEIQGVTGDPVYKPGYYLSAIEIPALGEWLSYENVPVVLLDVASPEGGTLDGIIGMNLFVDFNLVLRGGGLFGQDDPSLEFALIVPEVIDVDYDDDGDVDQVDFGHFQRCFAGPDTIQTDPNCQNAMLDADDDVDDDDLAIFLNCVNGPSIPVDADCAP